LTKPPSRQEGGRQVGDGLLRDPAAVGVAQKEDAEQGIDQQGIFDRMVLFLATLTLCLFSRVLGRTMRRSVLSWAKGGRRRGGWAGDSWFWFLQQRCDEGRRISLRDVEALGQPAGAAAARQSAPVAGAGQALQDGVE
jgi:hypothetical protein